MRLRRKLLFKIIAPIVFIGLILFFILKPNTPNEIVDVLSLSLIVFSVIIAIYITMAIIFKIKKLKKRRQQRKENKNSLKNNEKQPEEDASSKDSQNPNTPQKIQN